MQVALVDTVSGELVQELFSEQTEVLLGIDWKQSGGKRLSKKILQDAEKALLRYRGIASELGAQRIVGVATAVFREAENGASFIEAMREKLDIDLRLISQAEEGHLGFLTAHAGSSLAPEHLVAFDSGSASFQLSYQDSEGLEVYEGPWGTAKALSAMVESVQGKSLKAGKSPNPASLEDCLATIEQIQSKLPSIPESLKQKLAAQSSKTVGIGGHSSLFRVMYLASGLQHYTKSDVRKALDFWADSGDEALKDFPNPWAVLPQLSQLYAIMDYLGIPSIHYKHVNGCTSGILTCPDYWTKAAAH
jgi:exopolyphosphatase/guanosine-5'-triphosphate,3'-diphosphate pyrophosphatase